MSDKPKEKTYAFYASPQKWWQSILADLTTLLLGFGFMIPGHYLDSSALQWLGGIIFILTLWAKGTSKIKKFRTKQEAIDYINAVNGAE